MSVFIEMDLENIGKHHHDHVKIHRRLHRQARMFSSGQDVVYSPARKPDSESTVKITHLQELYPGIGRASNRDRWWHISPMDLLRSEGALHIAALDIRAFHQWP